MFNDHALIINLIKKYSRSVSYYTSYPTLQKWSDNFSSEKYPDFLKESCQKGKEFPFALYIHFPFCNNICYYCLCHNIIIKENFLIKEFFKNLFNEIELLENFFCKYSIIPVVKEIHFGGGSPSYISIEDFSLLIDKLKVLVNFKHVEECIIEIDPRNVSKEKLSYYSENGINRISLGIQDINPDVQKAINRKQPLELIYELLSSEIKGKFVSINFDLLYGLPLQTRDSFRYTIEELEKFSPHRFSIFNYGHRPDLYKNQRMIKESELPDIVEKTFMFMDTVDYLIDKGYDFIGIDHFAKPSDEISIAKINNKLGRTFNGYHVGRTDNLLGLGPSSLINFDRYYFQNATVLSDYYNYVNAKQFPVYHGYELNKDDLIRRTIIFDLICKNYLNINEIENRYSINFNKYFQEETLYLQKFIDDGLLEISNNYLKVTLSGRIFIIYICQIFDKYIQKT